jgi:multiple sugar transport system permease protein
MSAAQSPFTSTFRRHPWTRGLVHVILILISLVFVFPLLWMFSTSVKPIEEVMITPPEWIPSRLHWRNYVEAISYIPFWRYTANTFAAGTLAALGTTISSALVAYSFTRLEWPGRNLLFGVTLATMMIPFPVVMIPLHGVWKALGWTGTLRPLWVPAAFGTAFNIFLLRQFFQRIPRSLAEAMVLDGASELQILWKIYLPLSKAALAVVAFLQFTYTWNDLLAPLLFLTDQQTFTLPLGLEFYRNRLGGTQWHYLMAASFLTTAPLVVLFFFLQRSFLRGLSFMKHVAD